MPIQLTDEQTAALAGVTGPEEVRAPDGRLLGQFIPAPTEDARRRGRASSVAGIKG